MRELGRLIYLVHISPLIGLKFGLMFFDHTHIDPFYFFDAVEIFLHLKKKLQDKSPKKKALKQH